MGKVTTLTGLRLKAPAGKSQREMRIFGAEVMQPAVPVGQIPTTVGKDFIVIVPTKGKLVGVDFSAEDALATSDTNYITWTIVNKGQAGAGSAAMLAATAVNTTKATGGSAIAANAKRQLTLSATAADLLVAEGDRLVVSCAVTGTLANVVDLAAHMLHFEIME